MANFDPMACATATKTRKSLSVLWSITLKGHYVSMHVYFGLYLSIGGTIMVGLHEKMSRGDGLKVLHAITWT